MADLTVACAALGATRPFVSREKPIRYYYCGHLDRVTMARLSRYLARRGAVLDIGEPGGDDYLQALGRARYGLCPHGGDGWTDRVVDCILVGAIPVLFRGADLPDWLRGFRYVWDGDGRLMTPEDAEHNRALAEERFIAVGAAA